MSLRKLNSLFFAAALMFAVASCKDDEAITSALPSLEGTLEVDVPEFVTPGVEITIKPFGVTHPEGGKIGYCWRVSPTMSENDTLPKNKYTPTDTLQTVTLYCYAFADGYSTSSASYTMTVVKSGLEGSLKGLDIKVTDPSVLVDGYRYYYEKIGDKEWFRNNLANSALGVPFRNSSVMTGVFGNFYNYEDAMKACPEGWRLPSEEDWLSLAKAVGAPASVEKYEEIPDVAAKLMADATFNDLVLWEYWPAVGQITNSTGMAMVPAGYSNVGEKDQSGKYPYAIFSGVYEYAVFWTSDVVDGEQNKAYYRYLLSNQPSMASGKGDRKSFGASVRCVRDAR